MRLSYYLVLLVGLVPNVAAWGAVGHAVTATIAQMYLHPSTHNALCSFLPHDSNCQLAPIASWADQIKRKMPWSSQLHFVNGIGDHPGDHCVFGQQGWQGKPEANVLSAIQNTSTWMRDGKDGTDEALRFFVHFMGDLHQPLHLTGRNKGGNGDQVRWDRRLQKFHAVWDNFIIAKAVRLVPRNYSAPLQNSHVEKSLSGAIYDPYIRQIAWEGLLGQWANDLEDWVHCPSVPVSPIPSDAGDQLPLLAAPPTRPTDDTTVCPYFWAAPIHALNCEIVWPRELDDDNHPPIELDTPEYQGVIYADRLVERLLAMSGVRMAAVLNTIFGDPSEEGLLATKWVS